MVSDDVDAVLAAIRPLLEAIGGESIAPEDLSGGDVPITWRGTVVAGVRLPPLSDSLDILISRIETELGAPLNELDRVGKQVALRRLDEQGAFLLRRSIESVADTMDVSRITIYNYLNAIREE
ncbi:MAG: helix-turn-helix domain-containing protein [Acidimicrobiia bacterium]